MYDSRGVQALGAMRFLAVCAAGEGLRGNPGEWDWVCDWGVIRCIFVFYEGRRLIGRHLFCALEIIALTIEEMDSAGS